VTLTSPSLPSISKPQRAIVTAHKGATSTGDLARFHTHTSPKYFFTASSSANRKDSCSRNRTDPFITRSENCEHDEVRSFPWHGVTSAPSCSIYSTNDDAGAPRPWTTTASGVKSRP